MRRWSRRTPTPTRSALSPRNLTDRPAGRDQRVGRHGRAELRGQLRCARTAGPTLTRRSRSMVRHFDHLVERLGMDRVGFGSDFDGARYRRDRGRGRPAAAGRGAARGGLRRARCSKLANENWLRCWSAPGAPEAPCTAAAGRRPRSRPGAGRAAAAGEAAASVELRSAPDAAAYAGVGYLHALGRRRTGAARRLRRGCRAGRWRRCARAAASLPSRGRRAISTV